MANSFANYNEPFINGATLRRLYSSVVKDNIFQSIFVLPEEGCTEKYCEDTSVAQVTVLRILPGNGAPRSLTGSANSGFFNSDASIINETEAYPINLMDLIDYTTDIPEVQQDMMQTDLAAARAKILGGEVGRAINALTIAAQLAKNFNDIANLTITSNWISMAATPATGDYLKALISAGGKLAEGNENLGIDTYPIENSAYYIRAGFQANLFATGNLIVGGSNFGQQMIADGGVSPGSKSNTITGYSGMIMGRPVYMVGEVVMAKVELYLGLAKGALDKVLALLVSSIGTGRGLAFNATIKQIDSPAGAGIRMQPLYRFGAECWDGLSVCPIVANGFTNPASSGANLTVEAWGSRLYTLDFDAGTGATGTVAGVTGRYNTTTILPDGTGLTGGVGTTTFAGWNTVIGGTGTAYAAGDTWTFNSYVTLYAQWTA